MQVRIIRNCCYSTLYVVTTELYVAFSCYSVILHDIFVATIELHDTLLLLYMLQQN